MLMIDIHAIYLLFINICIEGLCMHFYVLMQNTYVKTSKILDTQIDSLTIDIL